MTVYQTLDDKTTSGKNNHVIYTLRKKETEEIMCYNAQWSCIYDQAKEPLKDVVEWMIYIPQLSIRGLRVWCFL